MTIEQMKRLRAELGYVASDPDGRLTDVQTYHLNRAIRQLKQTIARLEGPAAEAPSLPLAANLLVRKAAPR